MKKFEYKRVDEFNKMSSNELDEYGKDGWELCGIINEFYQTYYFKREITEEE